ncbi:MAG: CoA transferase subunit A [Syntrophomonadaceae bacterium]
MNQNSKVMEIGEAIDRYVHDGDMISFGGFSATQCPMAAVHEIIRQKKRNLHVVVSSNGQAVDELIGGGCAGRIEVAYCGNGRFAPTCFRFRRSVENGTLKFEDYSNYHMTLRFTAGAMGIPFMLTYSGLGSDIIEKWGFEKEYREQDPKLPLDKLIVMENPFNRTGEPDKVVLVPALQPDITILHAQKADILGNVQIKGLLYSDIEQARASRNVVVTCEQIVDTSELRLEPEKNQLAAFNVSAVVEIPWGAYPCAVFECYDYDPWFLLDFYPKVAKKDDAWQEYLDKYIFGVKDRGEFLDLIGRDRLEQIKADEGFGYASKLARR